MNKLTIEDIRMFLLKRDELAHQVDEALRLYSAYYNEVYIPLSKVCSKLKINGTCAATRSFMGVWERYFKDEVGWYCYELMEDGATQVTNLSIKRDVIGFDSGGDAEIDTVELSIPIELIIDPVKYIKKDKSSDYDYLLAVIAEHKKEAYVYEMRLAGYPLFEANNIVRRDLAYEENIVSSLEPFLCKMRQDMIK